MIKVSSFFCLRRNRQNILSWKEPLQLAIAQFGRLEVLEGHMHFSPCKMHHSAFQFIITTEKLLKHLSVS